MYPNVIARYQNERRPIVLKIVNMFLSQGDGEERCCGARPYSLVTNRVPESNLGSCVTAESETLIWEAV
jgi:hypothetical protein